MPLNLEDKKALVAEVSAVAAKAQSVVAAEYRGLTVTADDRAALQGARPGVYMRVVKNTLARKALAGTAFECIGPKLKGPLVLAFSKDDPGAAARAGQGLREGPRQARCDSRVAWRAAAAGKDLDKVASLPTREQALAKLLGVMKAPDSEAGPARSRRRPSKLVRTLAAVRDQKQARRR